MPTSVTIACITSEITISDESSGDLEPIVRKFSNVSIAPDDNCNTAIDSFKTDTSLVASNIIQFTSPCCRVPILSEP